MKINTYEGKTEEEAIAKAKEELGGEPVILNVKEVSAPGFLGFFKRHSIRITAAIEDDSSERMILPTKPVQTPSSPQPKPAATREKEKNHRFSAVANEDTLPAARNDASRNEAAPKDALTDGDNDIVGAFREVRDYINSQKQSMPVTQAGTYDKNAAIIKYKDPIQVTEYRREGGVNQATGRMPNLSGTGRMPDMSGTGRMPNLSGTGRMPNLSGTGRMPNLSGTGRMPDVSANIANPPVEEQEKKPVGIQYGVIKMLYNTLLDNEVDERYVNDILNDIDNMMAPGTNIETLMSSIYQKMVLKLGRPNTITIGENRPKVAFFVGPTGVGKTTTIAKIASYFKVFENKNIAFLTADTYRIKAEDQLREYANILQFTTETYYEGDDINELIKKYRKNDMILVDTFGFSYQNEKQKSIIQTILNQVDEKYDKSVYLVLSATTKYKDLKSIVDSYKEFTDFNLIFTKLDETNAYGNIFNIKLYADKPLSYVTNGQSVPGDFAIVDTQNLVKQLLGGQ